jgi:hypothetical protein
MANEEYLVPVSMEELENESVTKIEPVKDIKSEPIEEIETPQKKRGPAKKDKVVKRLAHSNFLITFNPNIRVKQTGPPKNGEPEYITARRAKAAEIKKKLSCALKQLFSEKDKILAYAYSMVKGESLPDKLKCYSVEWSIEHGEINECVHAHLAACFAHYTKMRLDYKKLRTDMENACGMQLYFHSFPFRDSKGDIKEYIMKKAEQIIREDNSTVGAKREAGESESHNWEVEKPVKESKGKEKIKDPPPPPKRMELKVKQSKPTSTVAGFKVKDFDIGLSEKRRKNYEPSSDSETISEEEIPPPKAIKKKSLPAPKRSQRKVKPKESDSDSEDEPILNESKRNAFGFVEDTPKRKNKDTKQRFNMFGMPI